ncbi:MAG: hypothetical protein R2834_03445 [Rhodothermales bacterium]
MYRIIGFVLLASLVASVPASAGPWTQRKGQGFYKFGFGFVRATNYFEPDGTRIAIPTLSDYTFSLYGEYGVSDRLTAVAYIPFLQRLTLNRQIGRETGAVFFDGAATTRVADADVGIRLGLFQIGNTVASASLMAGLPLGDHTQPNGLYTGDGEFNQYLSVGIGHSFYPAPAYVAVQAGMNNRTKGFSDEFRYDAEAGYTVAGRLTLIAKLRGLEPLRNGDAATTGGTGGLYGNNQRYLVYAFEAAVAIRGGVGFSASVEGATRGQNILSAPAYSAGIFLRR